MDPSCTPGDLPCPEVRANEFHARGRGDADVSQASAHPGFAGDIAATIVQDYIRRVREHACLHLSFYAEQPSLAHALEVIATWRNPEGKIERHQRRLRRDVKHAAGELIRRLELRAATSFEEIFQRVQDAVGGIRGAGDLAVYDVALRLAAVLGLPPQRVYLHRGSRAGARALGIRTKERSLPLNAFPPEFRRLHAWEIENLLSVYQRELGRTHSLSA